MESKEYRSRDSHRHRRSPGYTSGRERPRSPSPRYRERSRRSSSRSRTSPQRRGRGRSLSVSPPRRSSRYSSPLRRAGQSSRFRSSARRTRSRSRSASTNRSLLNRRGKDLSPSRRRRGPTQDSHYKKFSRSRNSRSRSPQRPRSPRTPPSRRRSYSSDRYSRSPLPFKPPSPPMRRSISPTDSQNSRRSRSPLSPRRPRTPRSPPSPATRYDEHRRRREESFERHSLSPQQQYYISETGGSAGIPSTASPYYYNVSPNRISLDARINIVLNGPPPSVNEAPTSYESYAGYGQYGGAAYMSVPPQPMPNDGGAYYTNPYVPMGPSGEPLIAPHLHHPHSHTSGHHPLATNYTNLTAISNVMTTASHTHSSNYYYNEFCTPPQSNTTTSVLKELPKAAAVAVQKGNVLEIVPSNVETIADIHSVKPSTSEYPKKTKLKSAISWKEEVNSRHIKSAVMRLNCESDNAKRSILKQRATDAEINKSEKSEKKKVYFEDGIYPSRDSGDEDRKIIEEKVRRKVLRLRKKRGIDIPAARQIIDENLSQKPRSKIDPVLEKLPCPPPPPTLVPSNFEQPIYLKPPTPVPFLYYHFDAVVHSMFVSPLERPIPPRLLNPKCMPQGQQQLTAPTQSATIAGSVRSPLNVNSSVVKKEVNVTMSRNPRVGDHQAASSSSNIQSPIPVTMSKGGAGLMPSYQGSISPQMSPLQTPSTPARHNSLPMGFVGMRLNNFSRLPPSPLTRPSVSSSSVKNSKANIPVVGGTVVSTVGIRHQTFNMTSLAPGVLPPPVPPNEFNAPSYNSQIPTVGYPIPARHPYFASSHVAAVTMYGVMRGQSPIQRPNSQADKDKHAGNTNASPQAMIAPYNVKKAV